MRSDSRLVDLAISPIDEAFKSVVGRGSGDAEVPEPEKRTLYLAHQIDEDLALAFIASLHRMTDDDSNDPINIIINCLGGDDISGFGIYDAVAAAAEQVEVIATVRGAAMSMASVILQAATERKMGANSYFMVHQSWGLVYAHSTRQMSVIAKFMEKMEQRATKLLVARSDMTAAEFDAKIAATDWYMDANEALRHGFVDEVMG